MAILTPINSLHPSKCPSDATTSINASSWRETRDKITLLSGGILNTFGSNIAYVCLIGIDFNTQYFGNTFFGLTTLVLKDCEAVSVEKIRQIPFRFPNLAQLSLDHCMITSSGVQAICNFAAFYPKLKKLALSYCGVTDEGLALLTNLKHLKHLNLRGSFLSNQSLQKIAELPKLKYLDIRNCLELTWEDVQALQKVRSDLEIQYSEPKLLPVLQSSISGIFDTGKTLKTFETDY